MHDQSVRLGQQGRHAGRLVGARVPDDGLRRLEGHVGRDGVHGLVLRAGGHDVDGLGRFGEGGVVPDEGDFVFDLVVAGGREGVGSDHGCTAGGVSGVEGRLGVCLGSAA